MPQTDVEMAYALSCAWQIVSPFICLLGSWQHHRQLTCLFSHVLDIHLCQFCAGGKRYKVQRSHLSAAYQDTALASKVTLQALHLTALRLLTLQAVRTCPVCRQASWFVTPSSVWPSNQAERLRIIETYKTRLKTIDCRHFEFGEGRCPFGTSCFYKHAYRDGTLEVAACPGHWHSVVAAGLSIIDQLKAPASHWLQVALPVQAYGAAVLCAA